MIIAHLRLQSNLCAADRFQVSIMTWPKPSSS